MAGVADEQKRVGQLAAVSQGKPPTTEIVTWFLINADTQSEKSPLHRLGITDHDAAKGNHKHRGTDSSQLFDSGDVITGDLSTLAGLQTAVRKIAALLAELGAVNQTTN